MYCGFYKILFSVKILANFVVIFMSFGGKKTTQNLLKMQTLLKNAFFGE